MAPKVYNKREYLTAIAISQGIIQLIDPDGNIAFYRQRGIRKLPIGAVMRLVNEGKLVPNWYNFKELPKHWSISFEDEEIMGKARATFPNYADKF